MIDLKNIREKKGISQTQLAAALGVSQGTVSAWETGRWEPSIGMIRRITQILGVTVDELFAEPEKELA